MIITYNYIYYYMKALKSPIHAVLSESVAIFFYLCALVVCILWIFWNLFLHFIQLTSLTPQVISNQTNVWLYLVLCAF